MSSFLEHLGVSAYEDIPRKRGRPFHYSWRVSLKAFMKAYREGTSDTDIARRLKRAYGWDIDWNGLVEYNREKLGLPAKGRWRGRPYEERTLVRKRRSLALQCFRDTRSPAVCYVMKSYGDLVDILLTYQHRSDKLRFLIHVDKTIELYQDLHVRLCDVHRQDVHPDDESGCLREFFDCGVVHPIDVLLVSLHLSRSLFQGEPEFSSGVGSP